MAEGYGGLRAVGVGRPGELAIPEPTEERHVRAGSGSRGRGEQLRGGKSPRRSRGLIPGRRGRSRGRVDHPEQAVALVVRTRLEEQRAGGSGNTAVSELAPPEP